MCEPMAIAAVAGAGLSIGSAVVKGDAEAKRARANQELAEIQRGRALQAGVAKASQISANVRQAQSTALTVAGGSGADPSSGTMSNLQTSSAIAGAADIEQARANAAMQAWGFEAEAAGFGRRIKAAQANELFGVAGAGLSGLGRAASALTK